MERQLDEAAGYLLQQAMAEARRRDVLTGANTEAIVGEDGKVDGRAARRTAASCRPTCVVMAVGIRPNTALAKAAGLEVDRGVVVDDTMRTSDPAIFAVGECVEHRGAVLRPGRADLGDVPDAAPTQLDRRATAAYAGSVLSTRLKVSGVDVFSAGDFAGGEGCEDIVFRDAGARRLQARRAGGRQAWSARCCSAIPPTAPGTSTC